MILYCHFQFNWTEYVETLFEGVPDAHITDDFVINVNDIHYIEKLAKILVRTPLDELRKFSECSSCTKKK